MRDGENLNTDLIPWLEKSIRQWLKQYDYNVHFWTDSALNEEPGEEFAPKIKSEIEDADFAILLISSDFLSSDFIRYQEMPWISERLKQGTLKILPIMVGQADWTVAPELNWIKERHIIPDEHDPLCNSIEKLSAWGNARIIVFKSVRARIFDFIRSKKKKGEHEKSIPPPEKPAVEPKKKHKMRRWLLPLLLLILMLTYWFYSNTQHTEAVKPKQNLIIDSSKTRVTIDTIGKDSLPQKPPTAATEKLESANETSKNIIGGSETYKLPALWSNSLGANFIKIPAGDFRMGSLNSQEDELAAPVHLVRFIKSFYIGKYEVTQKEWLTVMGTSIQEQNYHGHKPRQFRGIGDQYPMYYVTYEDIKLFLQRLNEREHTNAYRLPTESEWEYAARAGLTQDGPIGLEQYCWFGEEIGEGTMHWVGLKKANPWGLYDMLGNAAELIFNFRPKYSSKTRINPQPDAEDGNNYCLRGGSFADEFHLCQFSTRVLMSGNSSSSYAGFRLLKEIK